MNAEATFRAKAPGIMAKLLSDFPIGIEDAAAILGNLGQESGGLATLQEISPTVKGSRGGFGWAQWTGPRRRAYEAYCKRNKKDPASDDANYSYLFLELKGYEGSEKAAIGKVKAAKGLDAKVKAFELAFLRAGVKHYESRLQWAKKALEAWKKAGHPASVPEQDDIDHYPAEPEIIVPEAQVPSAPSSPVARPGWPALVGLGVMALLVFVWQWLGGQGGDAAVSTVLPNGAPIPFQRPAQFVSGGNGLFADIGIQIALAFAGPLVSAVATAAVGWVVLLWGRVLKTDFDKKSADALHAALERGLLAAIDALGSRAGKANLLAFAANYAEQWNGGAVKRFGLSHESLQELAVPHLAAIKRAPVRLAAD